MEDTNDQNIPWAIFVSKRIETALLVLIGLSPVILMFGARTPTALSLISGFGKVDLYSRDKVKPRQHGGASS